MPKAKVRWILLLSLILSVSVGLFAAFSFSGANDRENVFRSCVLVKEEKSLLVYKSDSTAVDRLCMIRAEKVPVTGPSGEAVSIDSLKTGEMIEVSYGGVVLAVWPPIYQDVYGIADTGTKDDLLYDEGMKAAAPHLGRTSATSVAS